MKYLMYLEDLFNYEKLHKTESFTLYRGTDYNIALYRVVKNDPIFLSTTIDFAKDYGKNIFEIKISPKKIFDSLNSEHWKLLFKWCGTDGIYDPYCDETYYSFDDMMKMNNAWSSDTWEIIENSLWAIPGEYDCILITEGGEVNFIVLDEGIIKEINKI